MPKKKNNLKTLLIIFAIVVVIAIAVKVIGANKNASVPQTGLVTSSGTGARVTPGVINSTGTVSATEEASNELVILLKSISDITLDDAIFSNPTFGVLQDISSRLRVEGQPGRTNPFLPIGQDDSVITVQLNPNDFTTPVNSVNSLDPLNTFLMTGQN